MSVPAVAVPGPVLVIARSANRWTVVIAVAVLFAPLVSSPGLLAVAVAGPVLVIARSANRWTVVIAVAVFLAALVSSAGLLAVTVAEFVSTVPLAVFGGTRAPILKLTLAPLASVPTVHVTTFGAV